MSFKTYMEPLLAQPNPDDGEWYLKATTEALNYYMQELEAKLMTPSQQVTGAIVTAAAGVTVPIAGPLAYFIPKYQRFTVQEVKSAMWCGEGRLAFINLFNLLGQKIALNFNLLNAYPTIAVVVPVVVSTAGFTAMAEEFMDVVFGLCDAMSPDKFLDLESTYFQTAIASIPPITVPVVGAGLIPPGSFTGVITVNFASLGLS